MWFTGRPQSDGANKRDVLGTSGRQYVELFNKGLRGGGGDERRGPSGDISQPVAMPNAALSPAPAHTQDSSLLPGGMTPTEAQSTVAGVKHNLPGYDEALQQLTTERQGVIDTSGAAAVKSAEEEYALHQQAESIRGATVQAAQADQDEATKRVERLRGQYDAADKEYGDTKIDPKRVFRGAGGTVAGILSIVGGMLGAFGASFSRGPNYALEITQRYIDNDIRAQETDLRTKGQKADNALKRLTEAGMDLKDAKAALRFGMAQYMAGKFEQQASRAKIGQVKTAWLGAGQTLREQELEKRNQAFQESAGVQSATVQAKPRDQVVQDLEGQAAETT
jgi:hypothetical protein